ncbi:hypothetical protein Y032_0297g1726 [Ancylostoma ceylanicum]|uniref:Uncharacterized protein n=1 Tax=Ancylostoma ceylanicum TaxID=53326 RepID=A0A016S4S1_9BILA|nr:hypothetical protein Y032_0297g1726 [Ancylostoma ceylanicum]
MIESGPKKSSQCPRSMRLMSLEGEKAGSARSSSKRFEKVESSETGNDCNEGVQPYVDGLKQFGYVDLRTHNNG